MVFSKYLLTIPYCAVWHLLKLLNKLEPMVFYCGDPLDHFVFAPVLKHLGIVTYVADKKAAKEFLQGHGIKFINWPAFPEVVIMARHSTHKFPCSAIIKIGMRHGAYHFKRMTSSASYNEFDLYLMTSEQDVQVGHSHGVKSAQAVGFPKLDPAFDNTINDGVLDELKSRLNHDPAKPTVLFTATYDASGMSAIGMWHDKLSGLTNKYNVLVTTHPWIDKIYKQTIKQTPDVYLIDDYDILPYIKIADVVVGDTSSILAESCALDKPMITFEINKAKRSLDEIDTLIKSISYRVSGFDQLSGTIEHALAHKTELAEARAQANQIFFDKLDGKAGERAAAEIIKLLQARGKNELV